MANDQIVFSPVLVSMWLHYNGSISNAWRFHLPQIWIKTTLPAHSWQGKWELTCSNMEEELLFVLPCNSTSVYWGDQAVTGSVKHSLRSAGQNGFRTCCSVQNQHLQSSKSFSCHPDKFKWNLSSAIAQTRKIHDNPSKKEKMLRVSIQISFESQGTSAFPWHKRNHSTTQRGLWIQIVTFSKDSKQAEKSEVG